MSKTRLIALTLCVLIAQVGAFAPSSGAEAEIVTYETESNPVSIDAVTDQILLREIEFLRMNTNYRLESTRQSKLKPWRSSMMTMAAYTLSNVGIDLISYARWKYCHNPKAAPRRLLQAGPLLLLTGHSTGLGGVTLESVLDAFDDLRRTRSGLDRPTFNRHSAVLISEIDCLISKRNELIARSNLAPADRSLLDAESAVIKDIRNSATEENKRLSVRASKWRVTRNVSNLTAAAAFATGGYLGALMSLLAVNEHKPRFAAPAGIGFTISGGIIAAAPILNRMSANLAGKLALEHENHVLGVTSASALAMFSADCTKLADDEKSPTGAVQSSIANRMKVYAIAQNVMDRQVRLSQSEKEQADRDFIERLIAGGIIGGTKIGYGIQLAHAGFSYHNAPVKPALKIKERFGGTTVTISIPPTGHTRAQEFNKEVAAAATTFISGTGYGILDALQARVRGEMRNKKVRQAGTSPSQILADRLKSLDEAEELIKHPRLSSQLQTND